MGMGTYYDGMDSRKKEQEKAGPCGQCGPSAAKTETRGNTTTTTNTRGKVKLSIAWGRRKGPIAPPPIAPHRRTARNACERQ